MKGDCRTTPTENNNNNKKKHNMCRYSHRSICNTCESETENDKQHYHQNIRNNNNALG